MLIAFQTSGTSPTRVIEPYLTGRGFGRLTVIGFDHKVRRRYWSCKCVCGTVRPVREDHLLRGETQSCGCLITEALKNRATHGHTTERRTSPEYGSWRDMIQRCTNPRRKDYPRYGGRGIRVCKRWLNSFTAFYADMGPRPEGRTLDRREVNGNYEPGNCRWATAHEQAQNKRPHPVKAKAQEIRSIYALGKVTQYELADMYGVNQSTISDIINAVAKKPSGSVLLPAYQKGSRLRA